MSESLQLARQVLLAIIEGRNLGELENSKELIDSCREALKALDRIVPESEVKNLELYFDGASRGNPGPAGIGYVLIGPDGMIVDEQSVSIAPTTNNQAEYMALIAGLKGALRTGCTTLAVYTDSELVANQINGTYAVKNPELRILHGDARVLISRFTTFTIRHIPRERNRRADALASQASLMQFTNQENHE